MTWQCRNQLYIITTWQSFYICLTNKWFKATRKDEIWKEKCTRPVIVDVGWTMLFISHTIINCWTMPTGNACWVILVTNVCLPGFPLNIYNPVQCPAWNVILKRNMFGQYLFCWTLVNTLVWSEVHFGILYFIFSKTTQTSKDPAPLPNYYRMCWVALVLMESPVCTVCRSISFPLTQYIT